MSQGKKTTVLLIEADASLRRLLTLGLQHRGMHVIEANSPTQISSLDALDLLIVDVDNGISSNLSLLTDVQIQPSLASVPTIALAWESCVPMQSPFANLTQTQQTQTTCLTKPFDARVLNDNIDHLLTLRAEQEAVALAKAEEAFLATYTSHTSPSIWPIITAIGVLIAFIGMMLHIAITVVGIFIIVIALLWWTLGTKPQQQKIALS